MIHTLIRHDRNVLASLKDLEELKSLPSAVVVVVLSLEREVVQTLTALQLQHFGWPGEV